MDKHRHIENLLPGLEVGGDKMKVGDLIILFGRDYGIIIHVWDGSMGDVDVLFVDGVYQVNCGDLEVINV